MAFDIIRNDITRVKADAIVNTANPQPCIGSGTDAAIYRAAGGKRLLAARQKIGDIAPGQAVHTPAYRLPAKYVIHTVGPVWEDGSHGEREILRACYANSLALAARLECKSIAFPLLASGSSGFPKDEALHVALSEIGSYLLTHEMRIILVVFDREAFALSADLVNGIEEFIDDSTARSLAERNGTGAAQRPVLPQNATGSARPVRQEAVATDLWDALPRADVPRPMQEAPAPERPRSPYDQTPPRGWTPPREEIYTESRLCEDTESLVQEDFPLFSAPAEDRTDACAPDADQMPPQYAASFREPTPFSAPFPEQMPCPSAPMPTAAKAPSRRTASPVKAARRKTRGEKEPSWQQPAGKSLDEMLQGAGETFQQKLFELIDASGMDDVTVYKKANIDRKVFSRIRCKEDYRPTKKTAVAFAIALELDMPTMLDLLARAEIAFSPSSKFDLIVTYFITNQIYDIFEINAALFQYDQPLLGA